MNPAEWLARTKTRVPDSPALLEGEQMISTYRQFARAAAGIGAALHAKGITKGDRVGLLMTNHVSYLEVLYGIWFAGAAAVPINCKLHSKEAAWIIADSRAALVFTDDTQSEALATALPAGYPEQILVGSAAFDLMRSTQPLSCPADLCTSDMIWLFYTSGTTGQPKGVMITCGMIASMTYSYLVDVDDVIAQDAILYAAPMSHGAGLYNFMHVLRGSRHVVPASGSFEPAEILELGREVGNISMFAAPTMVRRLVDVAKATAQSGEGIKTIVYAGGPMYEADILEAVEAIGPRFIQIYGQGECPMGITVLSRHDVSERSDPRWQKRLNSVGTAQSAVRVRIVNFDGQEMPTGETGEIIVRGATVMSNYWNNPSATAKTVRDGWLWTGDMGALDDDGYVTLQDRSKDMIISGGSNIYPREVEEVLLTHSAVYEVAIVGRPQAEWGEEVVAFVVLHTAAQVTPTELDQLCLDRIARFKRPRDYVFVDTLPKNDYGKVQKTELREWLRDAQASLA